MTTQPFDARVAAPAVAVGAAAVYAWWAAARPPFSLSAHLAVFAAAAVVLVAGSRLERRKRRPAAAFGMVPWALLVAAVVGFELWNFFHHPREEYPTMSSLMNEVDTLPVRRAMYLAWLALGWHLVRR